MMCKKLFNNPHYHFNNENTITYALKRQIENKSLSKMMDENTEKELRTHGLQMNEVYVELCDSLKIFNASKEEFEKLVSEA